MDSIKDEHELQLAIKSGGFNNLDSFIEFYGYEEFASEYLHDTFHKFIATEDGIFTYGDWEETAQHIRDLIDPVVDRNVNVVWDGDDYVDDDFDDNFDDTYDFDDDSDDTPTSSNSSITSLDYSDFNITPDTSIGGTSVAFNKYYGFEIVSPVFNSFEEFQSSLRSIVDALPDMETNQLTGCHINIGYPDMKKLDPIKLSLFADTDWLNKQFNRNGNSFTTPNIDALRNSGDVETIKSILFNKETAKKFGINFTKVDKNYVEFRSMGGINYHTDLNKIVQHTNRLSQLLSISCNPQAKKEEYRRKLTTFLATLKGRDFTQPIDFSHFSGDAQAIMRDMDGIPQEMKNHVIDSYGDIIIDSSKQLQFYNILSMKTMSNRFMKIVGDRVKAWDSLDRMHGVFPKAAKQYEDYLRKFAPHRMTADAVTEGAENDVKNHVLANDAALKTINNFHNIRKDRWSNDKSEGSYTGVVLSEFGVTGPLSKCLFAIDPTLTSASPAFMANTTDGTPVVVLQCDNDLNIELTTNTVSVLTHEFIHALDHIRTGGKITKRIVKHSTDSGGYYNSPVEFNAYATQMAHYLLDRINMLKTEGEGLEMLELFGDLPPRDFKQTLPNILQSMGRPERLAYKHFNDRNKRRLIGRLYALFNHFWELYDRAVIDQQG